MDLNWMFFAAGFVGALLGAQLREGGIELPRISQIGKNGHTYRLSLGGLIGLAAGALAGLYGDQTLWNAACWGLSANVLIQQGSAKIINGIKGITET